MISNLPILYCEMNKLREIQQKVDGQNQKNVNSFLIPLYVPPSPEGDPLADIKAICKLRDNLSVCHSVMSHSLRPHGL